MYVCIVCSPHHPVHQARLVLSAAWQWSRSPRTRGQLRHLLRHRHGGIHHRHRNNGEVIVKTDVFPFVAHLVFVMQSHDESVCIRPSLSPYTVDTNQTAIFSLKGSLVSPFYTYVCVCMIKLQLLVIPVYLPKKPRFFSFYEKKRSEI